MWERELAPSTTWQGKFEADALGVIVLGLEVPERSPAIARRCVESELLCKKGRRKLLWEVALLQQCAADGRHA